MALNIDSDIKRFRALVKKNALNNLKNYVGSPQVIGLSEEDKIEITLKSIGISSFQHNSDTFFTDDLDEILIGGGGVIDPFDNVRERLINEKNRVGIPVKDLLSLLVEKLSLPSINPPKKEITIIPEKGYEGMAVKGPEARRNFKQTFKRALKRQISLGNYVPGDPVYVKGHDKRYNIPNTKKIVSKKAVIINIKNASKNLDYNDMEKVLTFNKWTKLWLERNYDDVQSEYIVHRSRALVVDKKVYTKASIGGESKLSSAYARCFKLILEKYPLDKWNVYVHHFTDGKHSSNDDNEALFFLKYKILPNVNSYCYGKLKKRNGIESLFDIVFKEKNNVEVFNLRKRSHVYTAMGKCFGKGL